MAGRNTRVARPGRWQRRQAATGNYWLVVWTPLASGYRGRPPRSYLVCVERGNPVVVRAFESGRPIVRGA